MNIYGVRGYLTPDSLPVDDHCRTFAIPNDVAWLSVFMGALLPLIYPENWQQFGSLTPDESAEVMLNVIWDAYADDEGICPSIPAPYWDTVADVDDQEPEGSTQTWYGQIVVTPALMAGDTLTFVENAFIWTVAGFIAYAGLPGAAIAFVPVAQRFVLSFKQHSAGGIVKALIDFLEVAEIDTYGATDAIQNLNIVMPDDGEPHTLYLMMSDTVNPAVTTDPVIQVVRKELTEAQVSPTNLRWSSSCDCVQQTPDGGTTWIDTPSADPRHGAGFQLPPRAGHDPQCDAAANMLAKLKAMVNIFEQEIAQIQAINALLDIVLVFLPDIGIVLAALLAIVEFLLTIGSSAISAAFTDDQWQLIFCILYCDISSDGTCSATQFTEILSDIHDQCDSVVYDVLFTLMPGIGEVGLTNAGATGSEVGDCSGCACQWCWTDDLTASEADYTAAVGSWSGGWIQGTVNGSGCSDAATYTYLDMSRVLPDGDYTKISFTIDLLKGANCEVNTDLIHVTSGTGITLVSTGSTSQPDGVHEFGWTGTLHNPGSLRLVYVCGEDHGFDNPQGTIRVTADKFKGTGDNPFGTNNC